ncbi:uncharacterized protein L969DRAFT_96777 [Mixia osmundae IAM 14324]|uniref:Cytidyltransferase-like domain-containing protein n=1 Tax=Mixia osmundae (strain CBS 9802 / IAM 14324 / JCM 22182 / KY 12970) TaxID=764103 RepID=G7DSZ9_MIXOS|nr:uncharacterized protein L969DRAFT_96777 [Mixia osmundae IAM 14324]KEI37223.1 hypothetical protein L969DRAFT_96777 [Mixia osmundae IAM 14324]GAA93709.1 hypothetical protein E5Q_00355 [Mixia osmundae IAM 14324]
MDELCVLDIAGLRLEPEHDQPLISDGIQTAVKKGRPQLAINLAFTDGTTQRFLPPHRCDSFEAVQNIVSYTYLEATRAILAARGVTATIEAVTRVDVFLVPLASKQASSQAVSLSVGQPQSNGATISASTTSGEFEIHSTACGGTFDHLHSGHKILLTMVAFISGKRAIVGVTGDKLLSKKENAELLEPIETRTRKVEAFMASISPRLVIETPVLDDVFGPTATDPDIQGLVVSRETVSGGKAIDAERKKNNLGGLRTFIIDVISEQVSMHDDSSAEDLKNLKIGSTAIRRMLAE